MIVVEGQTEEAFTKEILAPHLSGFGVFVDAVMMGNARARERRGGVRRWESVRRQIINFLRQNRELVVTTMVDYYGMPPDWPGRVAAPSAAATPSDAAARIESAMLADVGSALGGDFDQRRFAPYVMMHEFEAMLFSDCGALARVVAQTSMSQVQDLRAALQGIRDKFETPESINDSVETAPSKHIGRIASGYQKRTAGMRAVQGIGLDAIRGECPHFSDWLGRLERLAG